MKGLMLLLVVVGAMVVAGCECGHGYPRDTFIGSSGWPASQVPVDHVAQ